jgi:hypothetical protein
MFIVGLCCNYVSARRMMRGLQEFVRWRGVRLQMFSCKVGSTRRAQGSYVRGLAAPGKNVVEAAGSVPGSRPASRDGR